MGTITNSNYESLWWVNIYNQKVFEGEHKKDSLFKDKKSISNITPLLDKMGSLYRSKSIENYSDLTEINCICSKTFSDNNVLDSKLILIARTVSSSLLNLISGKYAESDEIEENYINFFINKLLNSTNKVLDALNPLPVSFLIMRIISVVY